MAKQTTPPLLTRTRTAAKGLRSGMTDAERALWFRLRSGRLNGLKFRRQHPVPPYIVDFYCHDAGLVVELDGSQHGAGTDGVRTAALEQRGLFVLRFWDNQVLAETDVVVSEILGAARDRTLTRRFAPPSPGGRGEKQRIGPSGASSPGGRGEKQKGTKS